MSRFSQNYKCKLIGEKGQSRLSKAKICIVGAGGTGCPIFTYLYFAGVGSIDIVDFDRVEESNLNRQFLFAPFDLNKYKSLVIESRFRENKSQKVRGFANTFYGYKKFKRDVDLIIDATDNYAAKIEIQRYAKNKKIPCLICGVHGYQINIFAWHPKYSKQTYAEQFNCNDSVSEKSEGTFPTSVGILGTMVANEAIKILLKLNTQTLYNKIFFYNILENEVLKSEIA
jgi:adenylyltransferase/sulfurtransferase